MTQMRRITIDMPSRPELGEVKVRAVNGQELPDWEHGPQFRDVLQELLADRWQLSDIPFDGTLVFRRADNATKLTVDD